MADYGLLAGSARKATIARAGELLAVAPQQPTALEPVEPADELVGGELHAAGGRPRHGGVTSEIDFAFRIVAELAGSGGRASYPTRDRGPPSPPFDTGHPDKAPEAAIALMVQRNQMAHAGILQRLEKLAILG